MELGNIEIISPYSILKLQDINIEYKANEHGKLYLKCLVDDTINCNNTINSEAEDEISVYNKVENKILFNGIVKSVKTTCTNNIYYMEIEALTLSCKLDEKLKSRSFQDKNMTYKDVVLEIIKGYNNYSYTFEAEDEKIGKALFQYKETDWEFLKRLASFIDETIYADIINKEHILYFGRKKGDYHEIKDNTNYKVCKDLRRYYEKGGANSKFHDTDFLYYEIYRRETYSIGDNVEFRDKGLYISEYQCNLDKGELIFKYKLCRKNGVWITKSYNSLLCGATIEGEVIDVKNEKIKLHLDIDKNQNVDTATWFNYAPETGNMMYSMPKNGARMGLYFPDENKSEPKVINSIRGNRDKNPNISDTTKRYLNSENNKSLEMFKDQINLKGSKTGDLSISFDDNVGVILSSPSKLSLNATEEIIMKTPGEIEIKASNNIFLGKTNTNSGIAIENEFHLLSNKVIQDGEERKTFEKFNDEPAIAEEPKKGFNWVALAIFAVAAVVAVAAIVLSGGILGAAIVGAAVSVAVVAAGDMISGETSSFKDYFIAALSGAVCGAIFGPLKIAGLFKHVLVGGLEGAVDSLIRQLGNGEFSFNQLLMDVGLLSYNWWRFLWS